MKLENFPDSTSIAEAATDSHQRFALAEPAHAAVANEEPLRHSIFYQDQHLFEHQDFWSPPHSACPFQVDRILPALTILTQSRCSLVVREPPDLGVLQACMLPATYKMLQRAPRLGTDSITCTQPNWTLMKATCLQQRYRLAPATGPHPTRSQFVSTPQ